jgi:hypothetical protein
MDNTINDIKQEIEKFKATISPVLSFLNEVKDIRRELHISNDSNINTLTLITLGIKGDIIKEFSNLMAVYDDKNLRLDDKINEIYKEILEKNNYTKKFAQDLEFDLKNFEENLSRQNTMIDNTRKDLDYIRKDLNEKASYANFIKIEKSLKNYALLEDFQGLKIKIPDLAEKSQIESIKNEIKKQNNAISQLLLIKDFEEKLEIIHQESFKRFSEEFIKKEVYEEDKKSRDKEMIKSSEELESTRKKINGLYEGFKRKISGLFETINSKPWDSEIKKVSEKIENFALKTEIAKLEDDLLEKIYKIQKTQLESTQKLDTFDEIIERYDEILLDKASKHDISHLSKELEKFVQVSAYKSYTDNTETQLDTIFSKISEILSSLNSSSGSLSILTQKMETFKKENADISNISSILAKINAILETKADKSDILIIYDTMGRKEEIDRIVSLEGICRKQMLTSVSILQSLCRTLIYNGENLTIIKKQRLDIFKALDGLQKWIKEGNGDSSNLLSIGRSNTHLKSVYFEDQSFNSMTAPKTSRRLRQGSMVTSPRFLKSELPLVS